MNTPANPSEPRPDEQADTAGASPVKSILKGLILLLVLVGGLAVIYLTPLRGYLTEVHRVSERLKHAGVAAPIVFVLAVAVLVAIGCPRLLLCPIGGLTFGFFWGLLWTQLGTILGFYATFLFVHWTGREFVLRKWPRLARFRPVVGRRGWLTVILVRQMPIGGFYINILLGLTPLRHSHFFLGTAIGILPEAIPATLIGSSASELSLGKSIAYVLIAVLCLVCVWILFGWFVRSSKLPAARFVRDAIRRAKEKQDGPEG
jgi:uncharacterized membrane protein YdjX (TVP38/TMEM64 family)